MKRRDLRLNPGGLFRCCAQSCSEWVAEAPEADAAEGERICCNYEKGHPERMVVRGDHVVWFVDWERAANNP